MFKGFVYKLFPLPWAKSWILTRCFEPEWILHPDHRRYLSGIAPLTHECLIEITISQRIVAIRSAEGAI